MRDRPEDLAPLTKPSFDLLNNKKAKKDLKKQKEVKFYSDDETEESSDEEVSDEDEESSEEESDDESEDEESEYCGAIDLQTLMA